MMRKVAIIFAVVLGAAVMLFLGTAGATIHGINDAKCSTLTGDDVPAGPNAGRDIRNPPGQTPDGIGSPTDEKDHVAVNAVPDAAGPILAPATSGEGEANCKDLNP